MISGVGRRAHQGGQTPGAWSEPSAGFYRQPSRGCLPRRQVGGRFRGKIEDEGPRFDPGRAEENRFGLQGIDECVRLLRVRAAADRAPGKRTLIFAALPVLPALPEVTSAEIGVSHDQ